MRIKWQKLFSHFLSTLSLIICLAYNCQGQLIVATAVDETVECDGIGNRSELQTWLENNGGAVASQDCLPVKWSNDFSDISDDCGATGSTSVIFTATDNCGETRTTTATFTIEDTTIPVIETPATDLYLECDHLNQQASIDTWLAVNGGAVSSDLCSTSPIIWTHDYSPGDENTGCAATGSVLVTFTATDNCGLFSITTATITIVDTTDPIINTPASDELVACDGLGNVTQLQNWLDNNGGAMAEDYCNGVTWTNNFVMLDDTGMTSVIFTATDDCGNYSTTQATFRKKENDKTSIVTPAADLVLECDPDTHQHNINAWLAVNGGAISSDDCDTASAAWSHDYIIGSENNGCGATGSVVVTFTATDNCGLLSTTAATISITDTTAPNITTNASDSTVECDGTGNITELTSWLDNHGGATGTDACSNITWTNDFTSLSGGCGATGTSTVVFTATDDCGNSSTSTAIFSVEDTTPPIITTSAIDKQIECDGSDYQIDLNAWLVSNAFATATDYCSNVTWTNDYSALNFECDGSARTTVAFTATDDCGNFTSTAADFIVHVIINVPDDITVSCSGIPSEDPSLVSVANSCTYVTIDYIGEVHHTVDDESYNIVRSWTSTDSCGEIDTITQTITVEDNLSEIFISGSTSFCSGSHTTLEAASGYANYLWSTGEASQSITVFSEGNYTVIAIDDNGCEVEGSIAILEQDQLTVTLAQPDPCAINPTLDPGLFESYLWSTGSTDQKLKIEDSGSYSITVTDTFGCTGEATVEVTIANSFDITGNVVICKGSQTNLSVDSNYVNYEWNTGEITNTITVDSPGNYTVTVTDNNKCTAEKTVEVIQVSSLLASINGSPLCEGNNAILEVGNYQNYEWSDGSIEPTLEVSEVGTYAVTVTDIGGCSGRSEITIDYIEVLSPVQSELGNCSSISPEILTVIHDSPDQLRWTDITGLILQEGGTEYTPTDNGSYYVQAVIADGACSSELLELSVIESEQDDYNIYLPNIIDTSIPDEDLLYVQAGSKVELIMEFFILDRWGNIVSDLANFLPNDINYHWDGDFRGKPLSQGVYVWVVEYQACGQIIRKYGTVTLLHSR